MIDDDHNDDDDDCFTYKDCNICTQQLMLYSC